MSGRQGRNRKKKRSNSRNHWKRQVQDDDKKISSGTYDIETTTKTAENSEYLQSLDADKATRTLTNQEKEIAGVKNDSKVFTDKAKRVQTLKEKSKDSSCTINDGEICSNNIQHVGLQSITDEEKDDLYDTKECEKSLDKAEVSHLLDDLPNSLESGCGPTLERPATNGTLGEHLKENDQSLLMKLDQNKRNDEKTDEANTNEENGAHSLELGRPNRPERTTTCAISVCVSLKENEQNQYPETAENAENEEEIKRTNANGENISDSVPQLSESGRSNTRAGQNSTVILSAREYLEDDGSNLYFETDEDEENDEEAVETIAHEEETIDFSSNLLQSSVAFARLSGGALSETKENDIKTNADKENITYCLLKAEDSGCAQDQPTTYSISACEYLTKKYQNLFLETNESEEHEEETEDINADNTLSSFSNSLEPSNTFPHQNECVIPLCEYLEENGQNPYSETGENEANYEEIKQTNANEGNASNFFPYLLDSGSVVVQKNLTIRSSSEFTEENDTHLCYVMDERRENDNENQVTNIQVHGSLDSSNSCSDPPTETQKDDRETNAENITFCLPSAFDSRPTIDQRNTHAMSVSEYLNNDDQNLFLEMIDGEETEATNSNEEMFPDCVTQLFESSNTFARENENVSPVCKNLEENYQELYPRTEESKENDETSGEEIDEDTEEAHIYEGCITDCLSNSLRAGNTTVCAIGLSVQEFLKENEQNLYSQTDESEDNDEEMKGTDANQENVSDFLPNSLESDNTFAQENSARISSAHEYLKENDRNVYVDTDERDVEERQEINTHEEKTTDCLCNFLKSSNIFAPQARDAISETQGNEIETNAENTTDCLPNASSSTIDQPNTYAMSVCEYPSKGDQNLFSETFESKEDPGETDEIKLNSNQEIIPNCLPHLSEAGNTFLQQTKNLAPVCEYLEEKDQHLYFKIENIEENEAATEEANMNEETRAYYLSNSLGLVNAFDQSNTCDITVCEYLKEKEQNLYSETEESEDNDEEMKERRAKGENISDCLPNRPSPESSNILTQQKSTVTVSSAPEFLENQNLYFQTGESEENNEDMHKTNANEQNITDCVPNSIELGNMFDQPTIDEENHENHEQTSSNEGTLSRSLQSSPELCDALPTQSANAISVSEYLEQKDEILYSETEEGECGEETNENMPDPLYGILESCNNVAEDTKNAKSVFKYPEENDQNLPPEMKENEENGQLNENEESRQMKEQNIILLPPSTNLQNELDSFSKIGDEHNNNDEEMYKSDETSHDLENLACKSSSMLELALMPQTPNQFVDSSTYWNCASQQTTITEPLLVGEKITTEFSYKTGNDDIASMTENLPDEHQTVAQKSISLSDLQCYRQTCPQDRPFSADAQSDVQDTAFWNERDMDRYGEQCEKPTVNYEYCQSFSDTDSNLSLDDSSLKAKTLTFETTKSVWLSPDCSNSNNQDTTVISENEFLLQTGTGNMIRADEENVDFEEGFGIDDKKGKTSDESDRVQFSSWLKCSASDSQSAQYSIEPQSLISGSINRHHSETVSPMSGITEENNLTRISVIKSESKDYEEEVDTGKQENQLANRISVEDKLSCKVLSKVSRSQSLPEISKYSLCYQSSVTATPRSTYFPQPLQKTVSLVNTKSQKINKEVSENGKKKEITDAEGCIEEPADHCVMFEHSGDSVMDKTTSCLHDSSECIHRSTAADASSPSEVDSQMRDNSRSTVRIPSHKVLTVAEFLLEPDPNKNSEDDDIDCDCSLSYEGINHTQQENIENMKSDGYNVEENKLVEGCQKKDVKVAGNSETDEAENLFSIKSEENIDSDERETSYDEEEFSESLDEDIDETKSQPNRLVLKKIPDEGRNRLTLSACELFLVLAGLLLIVCTALLVIMYRQQLCFSYVFGPPPT